MRCTSQNCGIQCRLENDHLGAHEASDRSWVYYTENPAELEDVEPSETTLEEYPGAGEKLDEEESFE